MKQQLKVPFTAVLMVVGILSLASNARADLLMTTGTWAPNPVPNEDGTPFWDNTSYDGPNQNIGFHLGPGYEYLHDGGNAASFLFGGVSGTGLSVGMEVTLEITAWNIENKLWLYNVDNPSEEILAFDGSAGVGSATQVMTPWMHLGLRYQGRNSNPKYDSAGGPWFEEFAVFRNPLESGFVIGIEDIPLTSQFFDGDFQDLVFKIDVTEPPQVPEPVSLTLLGSGLLGLAWLRRRSLRASKA